MTTNTTTNVRRLVEADRELSEHFTSAVGGKAQRYDPSTGQETSPEEMIMAPGRCRARERYRVVQGMLADTAADHLRTLRLVYGRTDAMSDATDDEGRPMAGKPSGLVEGKNGRQDPFGLLRVALSPTWGHGSYLRIAAGQHRSLRAFAKRYPGKTPTGDAVLDFLAYEAGRGDASTGMLAELRNECEEVRDDALRAFDAIRIDHLSARKQARVAAEAKAVEAARASLEKAREKRRLLRNNPLRVIDEAQLEQLRRAARELLDDLDEAS